MPQIKRYVAKQDLQLDCSHSIKAGETLVVTSVYTCEKEGTWPLAILQGCFHALQEKQAAKQPVNGEKKPLTKSVRKSQGPVQTPA